MSRPTGQSPARAFSQTGAQPNIPRLSSGQQAGGTAGKTASRNVQGVSDAKKQSNEGATSKAGASTSFDESLDAEFGKDFLQEIQQV